LPMPARTSRCARLSYQALAGPKADTKQILAL
jgi:hypothetical protein